MSRNAASDSAHAALYGPHDHEPVAMVVEWWVSTGTMGFILTVVLIAWLAHKQALPWQRRK